ncbi:MAG: cobalamin-dependent protein [Prevotella sp.]|nr:cobalamin-dependent protein [Prevotella sp.]
MLEGHHLSIIGGCCGTTDQHIALMARAIEPVPGIRLSPQSDYLQRTHSDIHGLSEAAQGSVPVRVSPTQKEKQSESVRVSPTQKEKQSESVRVSPMPKEKQSESVRVSPMPKDNPSECLFQAILDGKSDHAAEAAKVAIANGEAPQTLINEQMIRAMGEVGQRFQDGKAFVPQLLMAGRAMKAALAELKPLMAGDTSTAIGKVVIGTVKGDLHDIGKNLVASMLEGCGFEVINIGIDVSADKFIEAVKENHPDILCMSALLTTTMGYMREVIDALETAGIRNQVKVMVGGAPVTQGFADDIGADGYSDNANTAVTVAKQLLGNNH